MTDTTQEPIALELDIRTVALVVDGLIQMNEQGHDVPELAPVLATWDTLVGLGAEVSTVTPTEALAVIKAQARAVIEGRAVLALKEY